MTGLYRRMKKSSKRLALSTQTIRTLQNDELATAVGGSFSPGPSARTETVVLPTGTSIISVSTSVISKSH